MRNPKLVKMTLYVIDFSESFDYEDLKSHYEYFIDAGLNYYNCMNASCHIEDLQEVEIDWDDDIDINQRDATKEMYDKYFEEKNG
jgi:hypothetical protein